MAVASAISVRRKTAKESFKTAAECIGEICPGMAIFAVTRGQFSMIDAILAVLDQVGEAKITLWTWTVAEYEIECLERLMADGRITQALMMIDPSARGKNGALLDRWRATFGPNSIKFVVNHSKIATVQTPNLKILMRGSMNLNFNPRFEQFDLTEGGEDFDLVREIEDDIEVLRPNASIAEVQKASRVGEAFSSEQLSIFGGVKVWAK